MRGLLPPALLVVLWPLTGCFDPIVDGGSEIACAGDSDCPTPLVCSAFLGRCLAASGDRAGPQVLTSSLTARRLGLDGTLGVTLDTDEDVQPGSLLQVGSQTVPFTAVGGGALPARALGASVPVTALGGDGVFAVSAVLVDAAGNLGAAVLGTLEVDATAPALEDGSVVVVVGQPVGTTPVADPPLAPGGRLDVSFRVDDLGATVTRVALIDDDANGGGSSDPIPLSLVNHTSNAWTFQLAFDLAVEDGPRALVVDLIDDVGNVARPVIDTIDVVGAVAERCLATDGDGVVLCTDADGDGFKGPGDGCLPGEATDCDDTRTLVFPGAVEIAGDDIDDDCDGDALGLADAAARGDLFVAAGAPADAAGTSDDPLGDLRVAASRLTPGRTIYIRGGSYALGAARYEVDGSLVGSLDASWRRGPTRTVFLSGDPVAIDTQGAPADGRLTIRGVDVRGTWCDAYELGVGRWIVADASLGIDDNGANCDEWTVIYSSTEQLLVVGVVMELAVDAVRSVTGLSAGDDVRVLDSTIHLDAGTGEVSALGSPRTGLCARNRVIVRGFEPVGVSGDWDIVNNDVEASAVASDQIFFGGVGIAGERLIAHNRIAIDGADGSRVLGISAGAGVVVANDVRVVGADATAVRLEDYGEGGPALHRNRLEVDARGCLLRFGRVDPACVSLDACAPGCAASVDNTVAPAQPPPGSAIDLGAPSSTTVGLDGVCRGATSGPGPG